MADILIVDDETANREFLVALLRHFDHQLREAADGAEALIAARGRRPDLIIADVLMPTMDGFELVRQLRANPELANVKVIFWSAHYHEREAQALARSCNVDHVLTKPAEPEVVLQIVAAALATVTEREPPMPENAFDREHLRLVTDKLSLKVDQLARTNERLTSMIELAVQLGSERDPQQLLQSFCNSARDIVGARYAIVAVFAANDEAFRFHLASGMDADAFKRLTDPAHRALVGSALAETVALGKSRRVSNPGGEPEAIGLPPNYPAVHSWLGAPILSPTRAYGWISLIDKIGADEFSADDERLAAILASQTGRVYENGSLYADLLRRNNELSLEVAERRQAEDERDRFFTRSLNPSGIFGFDGRFRRLNPACTTTFGFTAEEFMAAGFIDFVHPEDRAATIEAVGRLSEGNDLIAFESRIRCKDGTYRSMVWNCTPVLDQNAFFATGHDLTERKRLEQQLLQSQKLEAIGTLAGGVAHDFNNLLTVINGYGHVVVSRLFDGDPLRGYVEEICKAGSRAESLTRQLLLFSRKQMCSPVALDLNSLLREMEKMLNRLIGEDIRLEFAADANLWKARADLGQVEQVVMNLTINARDAMPKGGVIRIAASNIVIDDKFTSAPADQPRGEYICLSVSDTGDGMDESTLARIFEPFFTTKGPEKGTGLGLSTVYGIVQQSNGFIDVASRVGTGTTFTIYLPRAGADVPQASSLQAARPADHGAETILLVEDADAVRSFTRLILSEKGYQVLEASSAKEAIEVSDRYAGGIDLLLTDVVMPSMSGFELAEAICRRRPTVKVLYMSGYPNASATGREPPVLNAPLIYKPFRPEGLAQMVRQVLNRSS